MINAFIIGPWRNKDFDEHHYAAEEDLQSPIPVPAYRGNHSHWLLTTIGAVLTTVHVFRQCCSLPLISSIFSSSFFKLKF